MKLLSFEFYKYPKHYNYDVVPDIVKLWPVISYSIVSNLIGVNW